MTISLDFAFRAGQQHRGKQSKRAEEKSQKCPPLFRAPAPDRNARAQPGEQVHQNQPANKNQQTHEINVIAINMGLQ